MSHLRAARIAGLVFVAFASVLPAQSRVPLRPRLVAGADTNDAASYYAAGITLIERDPKTAADAFYWATRLEPTHADAFYARRVALHLTDRQRLRRYWSGERGTLRDKEVQRIDSLQLRALSLNPFLYLKLDGALLQRIVSEIASEIAGTSGNRLAVEWEIENWLRDAPPATRAWRAYTQGNFDEALRLYAFAIKSARKKAGLRSDRGRLFFQLGRVDSALVELRLAVEEMRKADKKDFVYVYESKALLEHSVALAHYRLGQTDAAREALGRALQEDLAFAPAHQQLSFMAFEARDTATAVSELDLAVQIAGEDEALRFAYGYILAQVGKLTESEEQLRKAIALNPHYASPHFTLGHVLAALKRDADATAELRTFLGLAARSDPRRAEAEQGLTQLGGGTR